MVFDPRELLHRRTSGQAGAEPPLHAPLGGTRAQRIQRLQIGLIGIAAMLLLVGLADAISNRAQLTEDDAVPEAAPTVEASESAAPRDPLIEAGVVPDHPQSAESSPAEASGAGQPVGNAPLQ